MKRMVLVLVAVLLTLPACAHAVDVMVGYTGNGETNGAGICTMRADGWGGFLDMRAGGDSRWRSVSVGFLRQTQTPLSFYFGIGAAVSMEKSALWGNGVAGILTPLPLGFGLRVGAETQPPGLVFGIGRWF